ncbi:MAG: sensor domain-containing diguanylate cyclase [Acidocella sp.]|nr:sensor domain-containing diguanylate cyclase [Acidocella sp.]
MSEPDIIPHQINPDWARGSFEHAPVSLWLEDYSALKTLFDGWRADGITDLAAHFAASPTHLAQCAASLRVLEVNRRTLGLFEAPDRETLVANLAVILRDDTFAGLAGELVQLWQSGATFFGQSVNYSLGGRRMDIEIRGVILPGHEADWARVLVVIDDVTAREEARRALAARTEYANGLFAHSPVSLWVEDFSAIKALLDDLRFQGITDLRVFTDVHPEFIERCMAEIRVIDVNHRTLELFGATSREDLLGALGLIFRDEMQSRFREQLIDLWEGRLFQLREVVNYRLDGEALYLMLQFSVLPGHEKNWDLAQIALTDITARRKAEIYLEYLGSHDVLTRLCNRTFYIDELARIQRRGQMPVTVIVMDLNGLKTVNDERGHHAGDALLRRAGEVLGQAVEKPCTVARIGGDEFAVLMPGSGPEAGKLLQIEIERLVALNNHFNAAVTLELSYGLATSEPGETLEATVRRADQRLLAEKRRYYAEPGRNYRNIPA